jgi:hypothetical protein
MLTAEKLFVSSIPNLPSAYKVKYSYLPFFKQCFMFCSAIYNRRGDHPVGKKNPQRPAYHLTTQGVVARVRKGSMQS